MSYLLVVVVENLNMFDDISDELSGSVKIRYSELLGCFMVRG